MKLRLEMTQYSPVVKGHYEVYLSKRGKNPSEGHGVPMVFGRTAGWTLVILAIVMASAEAVMALGIGAYNGLAAADIWTLLVGQSPSFTAETSATQAIASVGTVVMQMPAWIVFGAMGFLLIHVCRKRRNRRRIFRTIHH